MCATPHSRAPTWRPCRPRSSNSLSIIRSPTRVWRPSSRIGRNPGRRSSDMPRPGGELTGPWLASLAYERRMSAHTLRAYGDDTARFLAFLAEHRGAKVTIATLQKLKPADVRAFLTARRSQGLGPQGVQRAVAAIRSFYRSLERENLADGAAVRAV